MVNYVTGLRLAVDWHVLCQCAANRSILCQSGANRPTQCQSGANPSPLVSLVPFLTSPELPILISSHGQSLANPGQSGANPRPIRDQLRS